MNARSAAATFGEFARNGLGVPLLVMVVLAMMVLPLPAFLLDVFFTFNISLSLMILLAVIYVRRALEFATFPTVLLGATLLRLGLNVASTRVVLLEGHTGAGAAGQVIESFGHFLIGGNFAVGLIVFAILVVINFIVVTKGAERIAELVMYPETARFIHGSPRMRDFEQVLHSLGLELELIEAGPGSKLVGQTIEAVESQVDGALFIVQVSSQHQPHHAQYAVHWRADFMTHVRQKLTLGAAGLFGPNLGFV